MIRKLRQKIKVKYEDNTKLEEVSEPIKEDCESKQHLNDIESKDLQSDNKETEPVQNDVPTHIIVDEKIVHVDKILGEKEDIEIQRQSPITVLSEDEKCLFEDDKVPIIDATRVYTKKKFHSQGDEAALPRRKKLKFVEFSSVTHQGKTFKMLGEIATVWRPKNRPRNQLRLNMKKLLNPKLNKERVIVIDDSSYNEKLNDDKGDSKGKRSMHQKENLFLLRLNYLMYF